MRWGSHARTGSEHSMGGDHSAGEIQIFHREMAGEIQAFSFMIRERFHPNNRHWTNIFSKFRSITSVGKTAVVLAPPRGIMDLLSDSMGKYDPSSILRVPIRYHGSQTTPPCDENVVWTIFPRALQLSTRQMTLLRNIRMEHGMKMAGNSRPTQSSTARPCIVT
uniref:Carbonic anhydrase 4 n=1 Tax=Ciona savignyi TaxID=51511 RepID=H2YIF4_CIOSA